MSHPDVYGDVLAFHEKFNIRIPAGPSEAEHRHDGDVKMRVRLIKEESREAIEAIKFGTPGEVAQEIADLVYVAVGSAVSMGVPFDEAWALVHHANMQKEADPNGGKVRKPLGWQSPKDAIAMVTHAHRTPTSASRRREGRWTAVGLTFVLGVTWAWGIACGLLVQWLLT